MGPGEEGLEPCTLALAKEFHILEPFPTGQQGTQSTVLEWCDDHYALLRRVLARR